jgi:hypothetical protein
MSGASNPSSRGRDTASEAERQEHEQMTYHPRRRPAARCARILAAALLAAGALLPVPSVAADGAIAEAPPAAPSPAFGAFTDSGAQGVRSIARMEEWLGGAHLRVGHTYLPGDTWAGIEGQVDFLRDWADWTRAGQDRMFVLNVPMLNRNEGGLTDAQVRAALRLAAAGSYDAHYRALARRLVALGVPGTVVVLGWEMNGTTYSGRCGPDPEAWKAYWRRIVTVMRSVPGQHFRFDFAPNRGTDAVPWTHCYPGDGTVDIVGMDSYDQPAGETFEEEVTEPYGLRAQVNFAAAHHKLISYPEWGLFRGGDDPAYMRGMLAWIDRNQPLYSTLTDYCPHGVWSCDENPRSSAVFRRTMYRYDAPPRQFPCTELRLGAWLESWIGRPCIPVDWRRVTAS